MDIRRRFAALCLAVVMLLGLWTPVMAEEEYSLPRAEGCRQLTLYGSGFRAGTAADSCSIPVPTASSVW